MIKRANWIRAPFKTEEEAVTFSKNFSAEGEVKKATLYVSSAGLYEARINGRRVTDAVLTPGFTAYKKRILYQEYDVTHLIESNNTITVGVGNGWAVGHFGVGTLKNVYFDHTAIIAYLSIELANGEEITVKTDTGDVIITVRAAS